MVLYISFAIIGIAITTLGIWKIAIALASAKWPHTEGIVTHAGTKKIPAMPGNFVFADIKYEFKVKDKTHAGNRISVVEAGDQWCVRVGGKSSNFLSKYVPWFRIVDLEPGGPGVAMGTNVERILKKYTFGTKVTVYYDPKRPQKCFLEPGINGMTLLTFLAGVTFVVAAIFIAWLANWMK